MTTNNYFNHHNYTQTQDMVEDLTVEYIQSFGSDVFYLPCEAVNLDDLFGESTVTRFDESYEIEMYWDQPEDWAGQGRFLSKFGLQDARQLEMVVSRKRFTEEITSSRPDIKKPRLDDIILLKTMEVAAFTIIWVEEVSLQQRQMNRPYTWKITLELLTYSHEKHDTGIPEFDEIEDRYENLNSVLNIPNADNDVIKDVSDDYRNHSIKNPFGEF